MIFDTNNLREVIAAEIDALRRKIQPNSVFIQNSSEYYSELADSFFKSGNSLHENIIDLFHATLISLLGRNDIGKVSYWLNYKPNKDDYVVTAEQTAKFVQKGTDGVYAVLYFFNELSREWEKKTLTVRHNSNSDLLFFYYSKFFTKRAIDSGHIISFHDVLTSEIQGIFSQRVNDYIEWHFMKRDAIEKYDSCNAERLLCYFHDDKKVLKNYTSYMERILGVGSTSPLPDYVSGEEFGNRSSAVIKPVSFYIWNLSNAFIDNHSGTFIIASEKPISSKILECMSKAIVVLQQIIGAIKETEIIYLNYHNSYKRLRSAVQSAIGSIMSRNGSHNIGSHVLSSLSHNVGTMPEDRKLYQYIQHRMDYIATATTEFPTWRQPTMLVSDMIRTFLSQTHLLNYISKSEGLHAYQFQNPVMDQTSQHQTIMLNVRRVKDVEGPEWGKETLVVTSKETEDFINYTETKQTASFERDLAVAIPGGVVGQHAFFTILENTIRNAAKHEWAKALKTEKEEGNLEVYVDFHDNPEKGVVEMLVWNDRVGVAKTDMEETVRNLREKFKRSFISPDSGELVRENWGLAEMRISAGYLKNAGIDVIGGIGEKRGAGLDLVRPVVVQNGEKQCLGFRFDLQKPKELLVVVPDSVDADDLTSINKILARFGIEMMPLKEVCAKSDLAYSYVLINDFDFDQDERLWPKLPFRVLAPIGAWKRKKATRRIAHYDGSFYCVAGTTMAEAIKHLKEEFCNPQHVRTFAHELLEDVYASWLHHVRSMQNRAAASMLVVDVDGGEEGRAKSLVTDSDLLHFVFEHSFNSAVRGYLKTVGTDRISPQLAGALYSLAMLQSRTIMTVKDFSAVSSGDDLLDNRHRIATQLIKLAEQAMSSLPSKIDVSKPDQEGNRYVHDRWEEKLRNLATRECLYYLFMGCGKILKGGSGHADVRAFVEYLHDVVLEQARSFLAKYEERVVTLPRSFGVMKREGDSKDDALADKPVDWKRKKHEKVVLSAFFSSNRDKASAEGYLDGGLCYWRHGDDDSGTSKEADESKKETIAKPKTSRLENALYFEPLSGSQSYLNSLIALQQDLPHLQDETSDKRLAVMRELTGLVENALMHILIIDERATKFAQEHPEVARVFKDMGIYVCDDTNPAISGLIKAKPSFSRLGDGLEMTAKDFEIVIVHQGIIDKLLKDHTQANVGQILDSLMQHLRYLVVTTGRGTPFNIPPTARVLPFSVVESTLFKRYPEKMLLVDTVMHLLPGERK